MDNSYLKEFSGLDVLPLVVWQFLAKNFQPYRKGGKPILVPPLLAFTEDELLQQVMAQN